MVEGGVGAVEFLIIYIVYHVLRSVEVVFSESMYLRRAKGPVYFQGEEFVSETFEGSFLEQGGGWHFSDTVTDQTEVRFDQVDIGNDEAVEVPIV